MSENDPVSIWLEELKQGQESAARKLWEHFVLRLHEVARKKLRLKTKRVYDEQDAAQSAFYALCAGIEAGRFPNLDDRTSLWRLILVIISRKISNRHRYDCQEQRDVRRTDTDSVFLNSSGGLTNKLAAREPSPEFEAQFVNLCGSLFDALPSELQQVGWLKFEGYTENEIGEKLGCSYRTVRRRVELIRRTWLESNFAPD